MKAEREREAADERARGQEAAQRVRAQADRTAIEITSEAERDAQVIRGESDAERNAILAEAYGADEEFFAFLRSLDAYRRSMTGDNATLMLEPDSAFFDYLHSPEPPAPPASAAPPAGDGEAGSAQSTSARDRLIGDLVFGLGLVAIFEGLVLALAPSHLRAALETIDRLDPDRVRLLGLAAVAAGVGLVWLVRS